MKVIIRIFCAVMIVSNIGFGQDVADGKTTDFVFDCRTCHSCDKPTKKDPCLRECPRAALITIHHSPEEGPGRIVMDEFTGRSDMYNPVIFSHRVHAEMSELSGGCALCHHNNPPGHILACRDCHEMDRSRTDISKPDLMASYHRQCIDCHRAWSHTTSCIACHALKSDRSQVQTVLDVPAPEGRVHPKINEPARLVYQTEYDAGKVVTFYHNEHARLFGFECIDCHQRESCISCHDTRKTSEAAEPPHNRCSACHDTENTCNFCHRDDIQSPFNHFKRAQFAIDRYHKNLSCSSCHGSKFKKRKINRACQTCHESWNSNNFDHKITGLALNENHLDIDCEECHKGSIFTGNPDCSSCHDEETVYPKNKPGRKIF